MGYQRSRRRLNAEREKLHPDDWALWLREGNHMIPKKKGVYRVQTLEIIKGDELVIAEAILGPEVQYTQLPIYIPASVTDPYTGRIRYWHRAGELLEYAEQMREDMLTEATIQHFEEGPDQMELDLTKGYEETVARLLGRSTFGYGGFKQRQGIYTP